MRQLSYYRATFLATILGIPIILGTFAFASSTLAQTAFCHVLTLGSPVDQGFAGPWKTPANEFFIRMECVGRDVHAVVGNGNSNDYFYATAYRYENGAWIPVGLQGSGAFGSWVRGSADALVKSGATQDGVFAVYLCSFEQGGWRCGCRDASCTEPHWHIQKFTVDESRWIHDSGVRGTPPPPGGYSNIQRLAPTASLPSVSTCLSRVRRGEWEPRPQNHWQNHNTIDLVVPGITGVDEAKQQYYLNRIAEVNRADITGTTEELIQFFSCYWGVDDEETRARATIESSWYQSVNGDLECNGRGISWGLIQIKNSTPRGCSPPVHTGTYPDVFVSTGNNLNYGLALTAACYRGDMSHWIPDGMSGNPALRMRHCINLYWSGSWGNIEGSDYLARFDSAMAEKPWRSTDFLDWNVSNMCDDDSCFNLPRD